MPEFSVVIPLFNEEEVLPELRRRITEVMKSLSLSYEIIFINDGSKDGTRCLIDRYAKEDKTIKNIHFSRNFGHQSAITAGMKFAKGRAVIIIDADLQDPPEVIPQMVEKWRQGYQVVYGKRIKRHGETFFKKITAKLFYRFLKQMTQVDIPVDTGDFRLIDQAVAKEFCGFQEKNRFIRGLFSWMGFKQTYVEYIRDKRYAGETKYPLKKMLRFALDGLISFSYIPLRIATFIGILISLISFLYLLFIMIKKLIDPETLVWGWTSIIAILVILNGVMLMILGIMGEYIGRIYDEVRNRPIYIIEETVNFEEDCNKDVQS